MHLLIEDSQLGHGADWWRDATADYVHGFTNNPGASMSNWIALSIQ
jgi:hypothetical protein